MTVNSLCTAMFYNIAVIDFCGSAVVDLGNNCLPLHLMFHIYSSKEGEVSLHIQHQYRTLKTACSAMLI